MGSDEEKEKPPNWWGQNIGPTGVKARANIAKTSYGIAALLWVLALMGKMSPWWAHIPMIVSMVTDFEAKTEVCVLKACKRVAKWQERATSVAIIVLPVLVSGGFCYWVGGMPTNLPWLMGVPLDDSMVPAYLVF